MRLVTNPRVFTKPLLIAEAWRQVQSWPEYSTAGDFARFRDVRQDPLA